MTHPMLTEAHETPIGDISNYYGGLIVKTENGKFFWSIQNWSGEHWSEIPEYLYEVLIRYETERSAKLK